MSKRNRGDATVMETDQPATVETATAIDKLPPVDPPAIATTLPPSHEDDPLMSFSEVARYLGKSPQTIMRWAHEGLLAFERIGPLPKIRRSTLAKFLGGTALPQKG